MSPLFADRLLVGLAPAQVRLVRERGLLCKRIVEERTLACDPALGQEPWQGALQALRNVELLHAKATVVLSNHFVRYALVPWSDALTGAGEEDAYVRHHFAKTHGERAKAWVLRADEGRRGAPRLASAIDKALLQELKRIFPRLVSVQPYLMTAFNRARAMVPAVGAWIVVEETDRACVALRGRGRWRSVLNAKGCWQALLERERHRVDGEVPQHVRVFSGFPVAALRSPA